MLDQQLKQATGRFGTTETVEEATAESMLKGDFVQLDADGNVVEEGVKAEGTVLSLSTISEDAKAKLLGAKVESTVVLNPKTTFTDDTQASYILKIRNNFV